MSAFIERVQIINRIDQLIRLQATGTPEELVSKLGISKTKLYRILKNMRDLNAPVEYDDVSRNYVYKEAVVYFRFGFYSTKLFRNNQAENIQKLRISRPLNKTINFENIATP
ncbi:hypothetical protein [Aquimarina algiphila]|uniref:HTH domain-containing protein n=1 Tax=Aquimarina algiphila TaxID=2047982 RepID=A0A554VJ05_9FLAO|nr:hypothetical protein [Aquimarina algiphila]TSE07881.1 hypothetical protein FOF46_14235 [Aquimarina algiphila]